MQVLQDQRQLPLDNKLKKSVVKGFDSLHFLHVRLGI
jgi:hypothetical protein